MNTEGVDRALAALTPPQREAWQRQWQLWRAQGGRLRFADWLRRQIETALATAQRRLKAHAAQQ